jgi:hypothetical protein
VAIYTSAKALSRWPINDESTLTVLVRKYPQVHYHLSVASVTPVAPVAPVAAVTKPLPNTYNRTLIKRMKKVRCI